MEILDDLANPNSDNESYTLTADSPDINQKKRQEKKELNSSDNQSNSVVGGGSHHVIKFSVSSNDEPKLFNSNKYSKK